MRGGPPGYQHGGLAGLPAWHGVNAVPPGSSNKGENVLTRKTLGHVVVADSPDAFEVEIHVWILHLQHLLLLFGSFKK